MTDERKGVLPSHFYGCRLVSLPPGRRHLKDPPPLPQRPSPAHTLGLLLKLPHVLVPR